MASEVLAQVHARVEVRHLLAIVEGQRGPALEVADAPLGGWLQRGWDTAGFTLA